MSIKHANKFVVVALACLTATQTGVLFAQVSNDGAAQTQSQQAAQPNTARAHQPNPARQARAMGKQLGLSQQQVAQLRPILANRMQVVQSIRTDTTLTPQQRRSQLRNIQQQSRTQIEALLTDTQRQQFEQIQQQRAAHHRQQQNSAPQTAQQPGTPNS